jgi:predicted transposase/invertase (TIGR01784 family)
VKTDSIFYRLFQTFPRIFFELIGQPNIDVSTYQFASVELKQTAFRVDGVFVPIAESSNQPVYFVEVQFQLDTTFYRRFICEIGLYLRQNTAVKFWRGVVVYPTRNVETSDTEPYQEMLSSGRVQRIYLDELPDAPDNSLGVRIVQLIIQQEETAINRARELITQARQAPTDEATRREILELIETVLLYKFTRLSREEIRAMFALTESEFKQSRIYQSIKQEGIEEGKLEGKLEGIEEGKLKGKLEAVPQFLAMGLTVQQVAQGLGLTVEQVQQAAQSQSS